MVHVSCSLSIHGLLDPAHMDRFMQMVGHNDWLADTLDATTHHPLFSSASSLPDQEVFWRCVQDLCDDNTGVLVLPLMVSEDDLAHADTDLIDSLVGMGLACRLSWGQGAETPAGMDVWDPRDGKGQRFWLSPEGDLLVPIARLSSPHAEAHYRRFAALADALPKVPFCAATSAHALLAQQARFPKDAFAPLRAPLH